MSPAGYITSGDHQARVPSRRTTAVWWVNRCQVDSAACEHPRDDGVGVPHLTGLELVTAPYRSGNGWQEIEDSSCFGRIVGQSQGTPDRRVKIGYLAVLPTPDLVAENPKSTGSLCSHCALCDDTSLFTVEIGNGCLFDHIATIGHVDNQRRVVQGASLTSLDDRPQRLKQLSADADHVGSRAQGNPVQVDRSLRLVHIVPFMVRCGR